MHEGGGESYPEKKDWRLHNSVETEACWVKDGLLYSQVIFFRAFYFCLWQTNKQNRPTVESHERAEASLLQASNSFYSYILHSTSTACCISNKKPSRLTFAAHSLTSPLGCCLPSTCELPLPPCLVASHWHSTGQKSSMFVAGSLKRAYFTCLPEERGHSLQVGGGLNKKLYNYLENQPASLGDGQES